MERILNLLILAGTTLLSVRLYTTRLHRLYKAFFAYLVFFTLQTGFMMSLDIGGGLYQKVYIVTEPITWIFYVLVVLEVYSLVLADYEGLYTVGRWALILAVLLALVAAAVSLLAPSHNFTGQSPLMWYYYRVERGIYLSLVVFLITIIFVLLQYPIKLTRNIILHSIVYSVYFFSISITFLLLSVRGKPALVMVSYCVLGITLTALGFWLAMLKPAGEKRKATLRPDWMPGREEALVSQLNSFNELLLRARRK